MFSLFKKKLTPEECAQILLQDLSHSIKSVENDYYSLLKESNIDIKVIRVQLLLLLAFSSVYGTYIYIGDNPERDAVISCFLSFLVKYGSRLGFEAEFMDTLKKAESRYFSVVGDGSEESLNLIGYEFSGACGCENDIVILSYGRIKFQGTLKGMGVFFNKYSVKL